MTDIQGALGNAQMDRAAWILKKRSAVAERYRRELRDVAWFDIPAVPRGTVHGYQAFVGLFRPQAPTLKNLKSLNQRRNNLMTKLEDEGISTRQGTHAPVMLGYYRKKYRLRPERFPNAVIADQLSLTLPLYPQMSDDEQAAVIKKMRQAVP
jgi:dTDP-4-amino-4,6-dideoxygalactose transaminase